MGNIYHSTAFLLLVAVVSVACGSGPLADEHSGIRIIEADSVMGGLKDPLGISVSVRGGIFVADGMSGRVFKYTPAGEVLEFPVPETFNSIYPVDITAESGPFVYILDYSSGKVLRYDYRGAYLDVLISFEEFSPASISAGAGGSFILTDIENHSVILLNPLLDSELAIEGYGWEEGFFNQPAKGAILPGGRLAIADTGNRRVQIFSSSGAYMKTVPPPDDEGFISPRSICTDPMGNIFIADPERGTVSIYSENGDYIADIDSYSGRRISPSAVAAGLDGDLYAADLLSKSVLVYKTVYPDSMR